jgi:phospholipid transport system substrate-binding protein
MGPRARLVVNVTALAVALLAARPAWAGAAAEQLSLQIDRVMKTLETPELKSSHKAAERRAAIRRAAAEIFDFAEISKRCLGRHWQGRTPAEQEEFVALFTDVLERAYLSKVEVYSGEKILVLGDSIDGDAATVRTKVVMRQGAEIPVDYRMQRRGERRWVAYDVSIEGISLVANYRAQFQKIVQMSSYPELVRKLRAKRDELASESRPASAR